MRPPILYPYFAELKFIKGIGPILSQKMSALCGGDRIFNLLCHKPHSVIDRTYTPKIPEAEHGKIASFRVVVESYQEPKTRKLPFKILCRNSTGFITLVFFNYKPDALKSSLPLGEERIISGLVEQFNGGVQIVHPDRIAKPEKWKSVVKFEPQYPLTAGVTQAKISATIEAGLEKILDLPEWQTRAKLPFKKALHEMHHPVEVNHPNTQADFYERLAYDELLANQIALGLVNSKVTAKAGLLVKPSKKLEKISAALPFKLTGMQSSALDDILRDMSSGNRMFRLVQGDVGSGKTAVGMLAAAAVVESKGQVVFMAPTTLLAKQVKENIEKFTSDFGIKTELLTGNEKGKTREEILAKTKAGEIDILVGTHALIQDWVEFKNLGLVIIDEQHRFGVLQRLKLSDKNEKAHILLMTATPIPRSLTIAHYGEMDISRITEKPAERLPIETLVLPISKIDEIIESIKRAISKGEKIYWICPLVEESEKSDLAAAKDRFEFFKKILGAEIGLVHGKMKEAEKSDILQQFQRGDIKMLVATTVVEVGIDVRDATIIFIEHADRFGLSQLHQLRGRVGRGDKKSTCILLYAGNLGGTSMERLKVMKKYNDGFKIAEEDLKIRGAGNMLGTRQSGFHEFRFAVMPHHEFFLMEAREEAKQILKSDPKLSSERGKNLQLLLCLFEYDETISYMNAG